MGTLVPLHVLAGGLALVLGAVALVAVKGGRLHRTSGKLFVGVMIVMALSGATIAILEGGPWRAVNAPAGLLTAYLVVTALLTVRSPATWSRWLSVGLMLVGLGLGLTTLAFGLEALANGGTRNGVPAFAFLMFAIVGVLGGVGDLRMLRSGPLRGTPRLVRHLWRMCWAMWIATASFFLGPRWRVAKVLPDALVVTPVLVLPVLLVLATMFFWLWRVRVRRSYRGIAGVGAQEAM